MVNIRYNKKAKKSQIKEFESFHEKGLKLSNECENLEIKNFEHLNTFVVNFDLNNYNFTKNLYDQNFWIENFFFSYFQHDELPDYIELKNVTYENGNYNVTMIVYYQNLEPSKIQEIFENHNSDLNNFMEKAKN